jgi:hypothetical protein
LDGLREGENIGIFVLPKPEFALADSVNFFDVAQFAHFQVWRV